MLDVIEDYNFCSAACNEAIEVLDILKITFDDDDIEALKSFVKRRLSNNDSTYFTFESGRKTTNSNLASVVKIGIALKRLMTTGSLSGAGAPPASQDDDDVVHNLDDDDSAVPSANGASTAKSFKHLNDSQWSSFCNGRLGYFETKWTKKLEDYTDEDHRQIESDSSDDDLHLPQYGDKMRKSMTDPKTGKLIEDIEDQKYNDDWELNNESGTTTFLANQFWKVPDAYDIDDLMNEFEQ